MLELLRSIIETVSMLITYLFNIIKGLVQFIIMIPTYVSWIAGLRAVVPPFATVFFTAGITITVILFLINRQER